MDFLFSKLFWGLVVILIGLSIILNAVFKIDFPLIRIIFAFVIIAFGFKVLFGGFGLKQTSKKENVVIFSESKSGPDMENLSKEYNAIFGLQTLDLTDLQLTEEREIECNVIFGKMDLIIPQSLNVRVKANAVFGNARFPDAQQVAFGEMTYKQKNPDETPVLYIEGNAVFGQINFIRTKP